jgi:hypothetical protein
LRQLLGLDMGGQNKLARSCQRSPLQRRVDRYFTAARYIADHIFPIDQVIDERLEVVGPSVAVIDIIGMLPDIAAENGLAALHEGGSRR